MEELIWKNMDMSVRNFKLLNQENLNDKAAIAQKAMEYINDGDTIILDSELTTTEIAKLIQEFNNLTVITNALNIALILGAQSGINVT